jgi:hypothetical protein
MDQQRVNRPIILRATNAPVDNVIGGACQAAHQKKEPLGGGEGRGARDRRAWGSGEEGPGGEKEESSLGAWARCALDGYEYARAARPALFRKEQGAESSRARP